MASRRGKLGPLAAATLVSAGVALAAASSSCGLSVAGTYASPEGGAGAEPRSEGGGEDPPAPLPLLDAGTSPDAATALDAAPSAGFCATKTPSQIVYCNDFENGTVGFTSTRAVGGTVNVESNVDGTTNKALRVRLDPGTGSRSIYATQTLTPVESLTQTGYDMTFSFSVRSSTLAANVLGGPFRTFDPGVTGGSAIGVTAYDDGFRLDYAKPTSDVISVYWPPGTTWHSAWVRWGKATGGPFVQVVIDGVFVALDRPGEDAALDALDLRLGAYFTSEDEGAADVYYDDVLVTTF